MAFYETYTSPTSSLQYYMISHSVRGTKWPNHSKSTQTTLLHIDEPTATKFLLSLLKQPSLEISEVSCPSGQHKTEHMDRSRS